MSGKSALLIGATGAVGKHVLRELVQSPEYTRVGEYGRRVTPLEQLSSLPNANVGKLEQKTIDFEKLDEIGLKNGKWDVVLITLGTTRAAAGSAAAFEKIDREYVVNAARVAKSDDPSHVQRIVYLSSGGANASSYFLYPKSKGLTENALAGLGYADTIVFRPGLLLNADRPQKRFGETAFGVFTGLAAKFSFSFQIDVGLLGKSIARAGFLGTDKLPVATAAEKVATPEGAQFTLIGNKGAEALAEASL